jgi:hypothetical protein
MLNNNYEYSLLFGKDERRCLLSLYKDYFKIEFYADADFSRHLPLWDKDVKHIKGSRKASIFSLMDELKEIGYEYLRKLG